MTTYIKGAKLEWSDIWNNLNFEKDSGGRWYPSSNTNSVVKEFIESNYRSPSRAWPMSYAKPCLTMKFAKFLTENCPDLAIKCGVAE